MTNAAPDPHRDVREEQADSGSDRGAMTPSDSKALFGLAALLIVGAMALCAVALIVF